MKKREKKELNALERSLIESAEFVTAIVKALEDGKISFLEAVNIGREAYDLRVIYREWPEIVGVWKNKTPQDIEAWKQLFCEHFEISDKLAEERIELVIELITVLIRFKDTFKE